MKSALAKSSTVALVASAALLFPLDAQATVHPLSAFIDGAQANAGAGTGSPGTGSAIMTYDDATGLFSWEITWSGLLGDETLAHFHGPALPNQNAGIQVDIGAISGLVSPSIGSTNITGSQADDLLDGLWYINIHTDQFAGGEIRGQVVPEPSTPILVGAAITAFALRTRRRSPS
jgi:hypothetical protein